MPIPQRFRVPRASKSLIQTMSELCDEIEDGANRGEDVSAFLEQWHQHARGLFEPRDFTTYSGSMTKKEFVKGALMPPPALAEDVTYQECKDILSALMRAEIKNQAD